MSPGRLKSLRPHSSPVAAEESGASAGAREIRLRPVSTSGYTVIQGQPPAKGVPHLQEMEWYAFLAEGPQRRP